ncbi:MAG: carbamoyltransferase HypF [Proteobacteria bacterium]|nr:MAG: carbamoyltransferase HypF [Pseudomonadota bacterium]
MAEAAIPIPSRRQVCVRGQVQGVGFRPFVYRLAAELGLDGWVRNGAAGVEMEVEGSVGDIDRFLARLQAEVPPLARIDAIESAEVAPVSAAPGFHIASSQAGAVRTGITPDAATCPECLEELFAPNDRRYRYPFLNCTHCGPRYTLTAALPYDRPNTAMARFAQCSLCAQEYHDPTDRRFHAQPNACPACGPRLSLCQPDGAVIACDDPLAETLRRIESGQILAIKGLGGFHLVCDARNATAVARLRQRKQREEKPLAVMAAGCASLVELVEHSTAERALLASHPRPIVLLRKRMGCDDLLPGVAPGIAWLGVMLPYTPLHYLLFHEAAGRPSGREWLEQSQPLLLVMTSANPGGEPLVIDNDEAFLRLADIADALLVHDREILIRCDDSVTRTTGDRAAFIRRARGYTPLPIPLAEGGARVLATGAWFKNTVCLTREDEAFVSQHIGDLDNAATCRALEDVVEHLMKVLEIRPERIAHDLHPDFFSTRLALRLAEKWGVPALAVQHHHAHVAAVMAEHRLSGPVLALTLDGVGLGDDGGAWGGELLRVDGARFERLGHLKTLALPGGDRAAREPWRMAASVLCELGHADEIPARFDRPGAAMIAQLIEKGINTPRTSSAGRWFDAAAALLGVRDVSAFEGQAAMLLEGCAERYGSVEPEADGYTFDSDGILDLLPLLARLRSERDAGRGAARFHATMALALAEWAAAAARTHELERVILAGGCFLNHRLSSALRRLLGERGIEVCEARELPPNDGGISLGQAWVARRYSGAS